MNKNLIHPSIYQQYLDSAPNAADKGQAQYLTPPKLAEFLSRPLPPVRPAIIDLNAGPGNLLRAAANLTTHHLLACDIDPACAHKCRGYHVEVPPTRLDEGYTHRIESHFIGHDITLIADLLHQVQFSTDLFVLNPPWDLHWHRCGNGDSPRLKFLADSNLPAVAQAFKAIDPRLGRDTIDSSVATLLLALHFSTPRAEGYLITNASTYDRLIAGDNAPHHAIHRHIWATVKFPMALFNEKSSLSGSMPSESDPMAIALYFARDHHAGPQHQSTVWPDSNGEFDTTFLPERSLRNGAYVLWPNHAETKTTHLWLAVQQELKSRQRTQRDDYNLYLTERGLIGVHLSIFDQAVLPSRALQQEANTLNSLAGKTPMFLVTDRQQRDLLLQSAGIESKSPWRVDPRLVDAIHKALADYNSVRAPLYPLPHIQRLGYIEEQDTILCTRDLYHPENGRPLYKAGGSYALSARTVTVERDGKRPNVEGEMEDLLYTGAELATWIEADDGSQYTFLEARLRSPGVRVTDVRPDNEKPGNNTKRQQLTKKTDIDAIPKMRIDFTIQDLAEHFHIPEVPDISTARPDLYQQNLKELLLIESLMAEGGKFSPPMVYKKFQREDYARLACTNGAICAHEPGLGKTWACFTIPLLKVGFETCAGKIRPLRPVLIVAPGDLHDQAIEEAKSIFGISVTRLDSQATFLRLSRLQPGGIRSLDPGFYITSFHQLAVNGVEPPPLVAKEVTRDGETEIKMVPEPTCGIFKYELNSQIHLDEPASRIKCIHSPSLADLCCSVFGCVMVDEATRMKSDDALIARAVRMLNSEYKFALTATPIKNRVPDIFWLAWWTAGASLSASARFPYDVRSKEQYSNTFCVSETNLTAQARAEEIARLMRRKVNGRFKKLTPQACNIHRLWKLMAPIVLRRRKKDIGEQIAPKKNHIIRVPMATAQAEVYRQLIEWEPPDKNGRIATGKVLTALRQAAAAPHLPEICNAWHDAIAQQIVLGKRDYTPPFPAVSLHTPKNHAVLNLIARNIDARQQTILFSPFNEPLDNFQFLLELCGIPSIIMDGRTTPKKRGPLAAEFKKGPPVLPVHKSIRNPHATIPNPNDYWHPDNFEFHKNPDPSKYPVLLAGECMTEGHNFFRCSNAIVYAYPWALDKLLQFIDRIHRIISPYPVNVYRLIADGSIDRKMESQIDEKEDAAELILDGHLLGEQPAETNLLELLRHAQRDFDPASKTIPEPTLKSQWPALRQKLESAYQIYLHGGRSSDSPAQQAASPTYQSRQRVLQKCSQSLIPSCRPKLGVWRTHLLRDDSPLKLPRLPQASSLHRSNFANNEFVKPPSRGSACQNC